MAIVRHALALGLLLAAAPALAQAPAGRQAAAGAQAARGVPVAGPAKPAGAAAVPKPVSEAEMIKAQKAAEARSKAWDAKMRTTMGSICHGC